MLLTGLAYFSAINSVQAQGPIAVPGVRTLQVTIGAGLTQVSTTSVPVKSVFFQNNASHQMRLGDLNASSTRGYLTNTVGGTLTSGGFMTQAASDLNQWYVSGTANDVLDVIYIQ